MDKLNRDVMTLMTTFLDYASLCQLFHCNQAWFALLANDNTWVILLQTHFQLSQPFPNLTNWESYDLFVFTEGNVCEFCSYPTVSTLCPHCFDSAWKVAVEHYGEEDIESMAEDAFYSRGKGDVLTFQYASKEQRDNDDMTDAIFIIDDLEACSQAFESDPENVFGKACLDLSTGIFGKFWAQAKLNR